MNVSRVESIASETMDGRTDGTDWYGFWFGDFIRSGMWYGFRYRTEQISHVKSGPRNEIRTGPDFRYGTASHVLKRLTAVKIYRGSI